ncbi:SDR family oxidoreductase [Puerhibacterium sp. TATVAM-FAB25]|uniref:SDR family oxidoreductase n=1 Tax=Puerhibacterium sp. TATVAM-FAB25 TaxID=3093699 RepID=UPI00397A9FA2
MRTVVVTGSASGIGRATAGVLRQQGHRVVGVDRHDADVVVDLATPQGRAELVDEVQAQAGGRIDAVVANAGLAHPAPPTIAVNFFGAVATLEGLRPLLKASRAPRAVATASMAAILPHDGDLVELCLAYDEAGALERADKLVAAEQSDLIYASSKVALCRWVRRVAVDTGWAVAGIPLNAVAPGVVETPMVAGMLGTEVQRAAMSALIPMPLNGFMQPEVPARLLAWMVSEENSHLCGQVVFVDGGSDVLIRGEHGW